MYEKTITISNETGLHARPAAEFVNFVKGIEGKVSLIKDNKTVNAKSILNVLSLALKKGSECVVRVEGENAEEAAEKIVDFVSNLAD